MKTETEQAIEGLRSYTSTSWENGGPGESRLVFQIRLVLAEIEQMQANLEAAKDYTRRIISKLRIEAEIRTSQCGQWEHELDTGRAAEAKGE